MTSLVPIPSAYNNGHRYGGSSSVLKGCIILDLHRLNKIIEVSEEYGYAIVEPGVSFFDLYEEIQRRGLNLWPSVPAIGWGSVLGNTMDRGFGYTPNGEHSHSQCGMEVVLPNGELLRTGMGAMKDNKTFALYKGYVHGKLALLCSHSDDILTSHPQRLWSNSRRPVLPIQLRYGLTFFHLNNNSITNKKRCCHQDWHAYHSRSRGICHSRS